MPARFLLIPALIFLLGLAFAQPVFPLWSGPVGILDYDPSYQYLLNGLGLVYGHSPTHVDHPGQPAQMLIAVVLLLGWLVRSALGLTSVEVASDVAADPELYLRIVGKAFLLLNCGAVAFLGKRIALAASNAHGLGAQALYLLLGAVFPRLFYVAPEAVVIFSVTMLMAIMTPVLFNDAKPKRAEIAGTAFFIAVGSTTKITFLPVSFVGLLFLDLVAILLTTGLALACSVLFLIPVYKKLLTLARWYWRIATHQGSYGSGNPGLITWQDVPGRFWHLLMHVPLFYAGIAAALLAAGRLRWRSKFSIEGGRYRTYLRALIFAAIGIAQLGMTLKHFSVQYVTPFLTLCPTILVWSVHSCGLRWRNAATAGILLAGIGSLAIAIFAANQERSKRDRNVAALNDAIAGFKDPVVIATYHSYYEPYALRFGAMWLEPKFLTQRLPGLVGGDNLVFDYASRLVLAPGRREILEAGLPYLQQFIDNGRPILIVQAPGDKIRPAEAATERLLELPDGHSLDRITRLTQGR